MLSKKSFVLVLMLCLSGAAWATVFVDSSLVSIGGSSYSRYNTEAYGYMGPQKVIDGSGLDLSTMTHSYYGEDSWQYYIDDARWATTNPYTYAVSPSGLHTDGWIQLDFSTPQTISKMWVWNYSGYGRQERGWKNVAIDYSTDGTTWNRLGGADFWYQFGMADGGGDFTGPSSFTDVIDFGGISGIKKVCLTARFADGTWVGAQGNDYSHGGLSEIRFEAVPEPATMFLLGLGGLGMIARKRG
jgi:hypothetical protein